MKLLLLLLVSVAYSYGFEVVKERLCGRELSHRMRGICTPYGEEQPCYRKINWGEPTHLEKIRNVLSRIKRHQKGFSTFEVHYKEAHKMCCDKLCDPDVLTRLCCTQLQAFKFYKILRSNWNNLSNSHHY